MTWFQAGVVRTTKETIAIASRKLAGELSDRERRAYELDFETAFPVLRANGGTIGDALEAVGQ